MTYGYICHDCNGCYISQIARGAKTRKEHKNAFQRKGYSRIAEHWLNNNHRNNWNTDILAVESNHLKRNIKESLLMDLFSHKETENVYSQKSFIFNVF